METLLVLPLIAAAALLAGTTLIGRAVDARRVTVLPLHQPASRRPCVPEAARLARGGMDTTTAQATVAEVN